MVSVISSDDLLEKEAVLGKISISEKLADIQALCKAYNGKIVNANEKYCIVDINSHRQTYRTQQFISAIKIFNPKKKLCEAVSAQWNDRLRREYAARSEY